MKRLAAAGTAVLLFAVSAYLTIDLMVAFAGAELLPRIAWGGAGFGFESAKILTWTSRRRKLAAGFMVVSFLASVGGALVTAGRASRGGIDEAWEASQETAIAALDATIRGLNAAIEANPAGYGTAAAKQTEALLSTMAQRKALDDELRAARAAATVYEPGEVFLALAGGSPRGAVWVRLAFTVIAALLLELGAVTLSQIAEELKPAKQVKTEEAPTEAPRAQEPEPMRFPLRHTGTEGDGGRQ